MTTSKAERLYRVEKLTVLGKPYLRRKFLDSVWTGTNAAQQDMDDQRASRRYRIVTFVEEEGSE